jgi:hypothetical protein
MAAALLGSVPVAVIYSFFPVAADQLGNRADRDGADPALGQEDQGVGSRQLGDGRRTRSARWARRTRALQ